MITGEFTTFELPEKLEAGQQIKWKMNYKALNPGANFWSTCVMAKVGNEVRVVFTTKEIGQEGGSGSWDKDYNLGAMPAAKTTVQIKLFGHNDAGYSWGTKDWR